MKNNSKRKIKFKKTKFKKTKFRETRLIDIEKFSMQFRGYGLNKTDVKYLIRACIVRN